MKDTQIEDRIKATLNKVRIRLMVFSGKGGVGKSTVAANLGLALGEAGYRVGLLDVDIHGPNLPKILGVEGQRMAVIGDNRIMPVIINRNLKLVSMGFLLERDDLPVIWRGPLKMRAIQQFLSDVEWGSLDYLVVDSPPGTGDEPLSIAQMIPATGAIIVTTPQEVSLLDSKKAISFAIRLNLQIIGLIENMSGLICPHCKKKIDLFKTGGGEKLAREMGVPFLGRIPIDPEIVDAGDNGLPYIIERPSSEAARAMRLIVDGILKRIGS
ncbi:ATP-binding protein [candidate division WOR-3 bacterium]|uniref:Iron-sulfur cluster carrier protein n=1 Tax=candidate division WOR-3 bacterium TaxID=2052148 RepID=A0A660SG07_UNCW3|nr:MAG: ATP-binding protein [candidate division WOR-3 bacterium]